MNGKPFNSLGSLHGEELQVTGYTLVMNELPISDVITPDKQDADSLEYGNKKECSNFLIIMV